MKYLWTRILPPSGVTPGYTWTREENALLIANTILPLSVSRNFHETEQTPLKVIKLDLAADGSVLALLTGPDEGLYELTGDCRIAPAILTDTRDPQTGARLGPRLIDCALTFEPPPAGFDPTLGRIKFNSPRLPRSKADQVSGRSAGRCCS